MIDDVLGQLNGVRKNGSGWSARCPGHDDTRASLSISVGGDNRILMECHAGCEFRAIVEAAGLRTSDFFPPNGADTNGHLRSRQIVQTYDYRDEAGLPDVSISELAEENVQPALITDDYSLPDTARQFLQDATKRLRKRFELGY